MNLRDLQKKKITRFIKTYAAVPRIENLINKAKEEKSFNWLR